ncbi:prefoldin domain-containing protein [Streptomyces sp. NBC_01255]|uniref:prefoldin domain-containing protein n=1 Tax=Streptomyces sp. NBC_01255 TaxID=2903798 RepID=UPI002E349BFF|nr:prefoldin domain-containing protein [Streptomyces sp. NBC_01255]
MATSNRLLRYAESRKNLTGCAAGLAGLALTLTGAAGSLWPLVVVGLYGAGALIAPPERPDTPHFPSADEQLDALRADFVKLRAYLTEVELPSATRERLTALGTLIEALLEPGWVSDPEHLHVLARAVRLDIPEAVDTFVRTRWWSRFTSGSEAPESHLERQLAALHEEATAIATALQEAEAIRQQIHTEYVEGRGN